MEDQMVHISTLVHVTQRSNLLSIMRNGLVPGASRVLEEGFGGRPHIYFGTYLPEDPRFVTGKRDAPGCDTVIVYDLDLQESIMWE